MIDEKKLTYYFKKYSESLQNVVWQKLGKYFHYNSLGPLQLVYLCPLCLINKIGVVGSHIYYDAEFTLDHFPPASVGGKNTVLVCEKCNNEAGAKYDYTIKEWIRLMSFQKKIPNSKVPILLEFQHTKGIYKGNMIMTDDSKISLDEFDKYPFARNWFENMLKGNPSEQTITIRKPEEELLQKANLKSAYLYCFSIWGYDFIYSPTGLRIRNVLFNIEQHPLSNMGVLFHTGELTPPDGLCYVYKPKELQTFMINYKLNSIETGYTCGVSVLISGSDDNSWFNLKSYQTFIDNQEKFTSALIKLPENLLSSQNIFPYTKAWQDRDKYKIYGEDK